MRIPCPLCGLRSLEEFTYRGEASAERPPPDDSRPGVWHAYVHLRDNIRGRHREHWQHTFGCRAWLVIDRDTQTRVIHASTLARPHREAPVP